MADNVLNNSSGVPSSSSSPASALTGNRISDAIDWTSSVFDSTGNLVGGLLDTYSGFADRLSALQDSKETTVTTTPYEGTNVGVQSVADSAFKEKVLIGGVGIAILGVLGILIFKK